MHYTDDDIRDRARAMRKNPTTAERRIWAWLRGRHFGDFKFRRQHPIGRYIIDFYCAALRLAIEMDGNQHSDFSVAAVDQQRTDSLAALGIEVVRISNYTLMRDPILVSQTIEWAIGRALKRVASRATSSPAGRGELR